MVDLDWLIGTNILSCDMDWLTLIAVMIGVTSLVFAAKGNV